MVSNLIAIVIPIAIIGGSMAYATEPRETDAKQAQAIELIVDQMTKMNSRLSKLESERKQALIRDEITQNPQLIKIASDLASAVTQQRQPDQQETFFKLMADISCQVLKDGCVLRSRMRELEYRIHELERERLNPNRPTPEPSVQQPNDSPQPSLVQPSIPWSPAVQSPQPWRRWNGVPDYILDSRTKLDYDAVLFRQCVDVQSDTPLHGNVYIDSSGKFVLVRHNKTRTTVPYFVARRPL